MLGCVTISMIANATGWLTGRLAGRQVGWLLVDNYEVIVVKIKLTHLLRYLHF